MKRTGTSLDLPSSWVIYRLSDGAVICETFNREWVDKLNTAKYEAVDVLAHLQDCNARIKRGEPLRPVAHPPDQSHR
jgi:hypothetical protein